MDAKPKIPRICYGGPRIQVYTDGSIVSCSSDMPARWPCGNIMDTDLMELWRSPEFRKMHHELRTTGYSGKPCSYCAKKFH